MKQILASAATYLVWVSCGNADPNQLPHYHLVALTERGIILQLGGPEEGDSGTLTLSRDGRGTGEMVRGIGESIPLDGTWTVRDGQLCRTWGADHSGSEVCEVWVRKSGNSADIYVNGVLAGSSSW